LNQKIKRELFDRRMAIIRNIENIVDGFINNKDILENINALSEQYYLIDLLFEKNEAKLLTRFIEIIEEYKRTKKSIDLNKAVLYYDEYLKFELRNMMCLVDLGKELDEQTKNWKNFPSFPRSAWECIETKSGAKNG
jgi:hypothetical protein